MRPEIRAAIEQAAREEGVDPAFALAVAERESSGDPHARNSKTIRGLFQMRADHRQRYGIGDSDDPYVQAKGWARFIKDERADASRAAGRELNDAETYGAHHWGSGRAGRMLKMDPATPVDQVFTPYERSLNPHFDRAGTVGNLLSSVTSDIQRRQAKFGGAQGEVDFAKFGEPVEPLFDQTPDFTALSDGANLNTGSVQAASSAPDFSKLGVPVNDLA